MERNRPRSGHAIEALTVAVLILLGGCHRSTTDTTTPKRDRPAAIHLGAVTFLSGPAAAFGGPAKNGFELVLDAINAGTLPAPYNTRGFAGVPGEAIWVDESGGNTQQVTEYKNLVEGRGVDAVIGYVSSGSCLAVAPLVDSLRTLTVFATCATPRIFDEGQHRYLFRTINTATAEAAAAARYVKERYSAAPPHFTGINANYAFGQDSWNEFTAAMGALMPAAQASSSPQWPKLFSGQYAVEISALLLDDASLVHSSLWGGDLESFLLQASSRGLIGKKKLLLTVGEPSVSRLGHDFPEGVILGAHGPYGLVAQAFPTPLNQWFVAAYRAKYGGESPSFPAYQMAQALLATKIAFDRAGAAHPAAFPASDDVVAAFEHMEFEAFGVTVKMAHDGGHQAVTPNAFAVTKRNAAAAIELADVSIYSAGCVMPPDGVSASSWMTNGFASASCERR